MATQPENTTPQTASHQGSTHRSSRDAKITGISHLAIKLSTKPAAPPITPTISASERNILKMSLRTVPSTFSTPISRVRSVMDIIMVFATQMAEIRTAIPPSAPSIPWICRDCVRTVSSISLSE